MKINRENYEPYFIDLLDGTLSNEMVDELLDFLRLNPDLAEELKGLEAIQLHPDNSIKFNHQSLLKTGFDQPDVFNETCIRSIENDLTKAEETQFQRYIKNNEKAAAEYELFRATISEPDLLITYPDKSSLKHKVKVMPLWYAVAAVLLLGILFWFNTPKQEEIIEPLAQAVPVLNEKPQPKINVNALKNEFARIEAKDIRQPVKAEQAKQEIQPRNEELIQPMLANLSIPAIDIPEENNFALATIPAKDKLTEFYPTVPELLVAEVNKIDVKSEARKIGHFALDKLRDITDDKLSYATNQNGNVKKIEYNSRLLAFSVPVNLKNNQ